MDTITLARKPFTPGEILLEEFMEPLNLTQQALADSMRVPRRRINEIVKGRRAVTPDTAIRLSKVFGTSAEVWLNLQRQWDLWNALHNEKMQGEYEKIERLMS
jgi:addiction module HigA family antidote